jgi:hypothetical protein
MRSVERLFHSIKTSREGEGLSSYTIFARTIARKGFEKKVINKWFDKLVDREDYTRVKKKVLLQYLYDLNTPVEGQNRG